MSQEETPGALPVQELQVTHPRLVAVLVVHDGLEWLPVLFATLSRWRHPGLELVVVDNGSTDGSAALLAERIPPERLLTLARPVGFGRAVAAARTHPAVAAADYLLLLHDDLLLAPDAVTRMVESLRADPQLAVVGPKLREWTSEPVIQQVGMTVDRFGRAETRTERDELDQGQHDDRRDVLYVSTAGMMIRNAVFAELGGFDPRFVLMRDDLDLCWRAWLVGHRVEVVPEAVGYHLAAGTRNARQVGRGRPWEARYLAERHGLAALIKNYSGPRLAWVLPVTVLLALVKFAGFLATRRFGSAAATVRAYGWNLRELPATLRRRRVVQRARVRTDDQLGPLFAAGLPRIRDYAEAIGGWIGGADTRAILDEEEIRSPEQAAATSGRSLVRSAVRHPAVTVGGVLLVAFLVGLVRLLDPGQLVGGQILPWPEHPSEFLRAYTSRWNVDPVASPGFASPIQAVLGLASYGGFGSAWLAQRLLVLGLLPVAWVGALRTARAVTVRAAPRALGATVYVLSPAVLGTLAQGQYGALVLAAVLPGLVAVGIRAARRDSPPGDAWRAAAFLALLLALGVAAAPALWIVPVSVALGALLTAARPGKGRGPAMARLVTAAALAFAILAPWLWDLLRSPDTAAPTSTVSLRAWEALLGVPGVVPGLGGAGALIVGATTVGIVLAALFFGLPRRTAVVVPLIGAAVGWAVVAWGAGRLGLHVWTPGLLLPASLAVGGLAVVAARSLLDSLRESAFGLQQFVAVVAAGVVGAGLLAGVAKLASGPWEELAVAPDLVPLFVGADVERVGPYRILLLASDGNQVTWEVSPGSGPSMVSYGTTPNPATVDAIDEAVVALVSADPRAAAQLGAAGVRYLVLQEGPVTDALAGTIAQQRGLEPIASGRGRVIRVQPWLPRATVLTSAQAHQFGSGILTDTDELAEDRLLSSRPGRYTGRASEPGLLVLTEPVSGVWEAERGGNRLERGTLPGAGWPVAAFDVDTPGPVRVYTTGTTRHLVLVALQAVLALLILSLALRPPSFVDETVRRRVGDLPVNLAAADPDTPGGSEPAPVKDRV